MGTQSQARLSEEEYLALECRAETRSEFLSGEMFLMTGASIRHNRIVSNALAALHPQLTSRGCDVFASDLRVRTPGGLFAYPDLVVVYGEPELYDGEGDTVLNPMLIAEVLSPSTEGYDRGLKFVHYRKIASLTDYLLISQDRVMIEHFNRQGDLWQLRTLDDPAGTLELPAYNASLALQAVYRGTDGLT